MYDRWFLYTNIVIVASLSIYSILCICICLIYFSLSLLYLLIYWCLHLYSCTCSTCLPFGPWCKLKLGPNMILFGNHFELKFLEHICSTVPCYLLVRSSCLLMQSPIASTKEIRELIGSLLRLERSTFSPA